MTLNNDQNKKAAKKKAPKIVAVVGPTATGKTSMGVSLAQYLNSEVISADSQIIYRELDIGTAKPTEEEMNGVPHHMINLVAPNESYSVARYEKEATRVLERLLAEGKVPVVVGGTGFYIRALLESHFVPDVPPDPTFRKEMKTLADDKGLAHLHQLLKEKDPERADMLHPNDEFRVVRALEIIHQTGKPVPKASEAKPKPFDVTWMGLTYSERDAHRAQIDRRINEMVEAGWLEEVEHLLKKYGTGAEALKVSHGYPEWIQHLQGYRTYDDALEQIQINIHQYSRRQMTWFKRNENIIWQYTDKLGPASMIQMGINCVENALAKS